MIKRHVDRSRAPARRSGDAFSGSGVPASPERHLGSLRSLDATHERAGAADWSHRVCIRCGEACITEASSPKPFEGFFSAARMELHFAEREGPTRTKKRLVDRSPGIGPGRSVDDFQGAGVMVRQEKTPQLAMCLASGRHLDSLHSLDATHERAGAAGSFPSVCSPLAEVCP